MKDCGTVGNKADSTKSELTAVKARVLKLENKNEIVRWIRISLSQILHVVPLEVLLKVTEDMVRYNKIIIKNYL